MTAPTFAPWQRRPRPPRRVRCAVCMDVVLLRSTWPLWGERVCRAHLSDDDRRIYKAEQSDRSEP